MKNKILFLASILVGCGLFFVACKKDEVNDSVPHTTSQPYIVEQFTNEIYPYGLGNVTIQDDIPDIVAIVVDSVYGFEGGYGGKTGADTAQLKKTDLLGSWPTITKTGSYSVSFAKFNKGGYRIIISPSIVVVKNDNPGPTALEGSYLRTATGVIVEIKKAVDGVYVLDNPGGANTVPVLYVLYNYMSSTGTDSLAFPIQLNSACGTGLQLVGATASPGSTSSTYSSSYPPQIVSYAPITLQWRIFTFDGTSPSSATTAVCQWGEAVRTLIKQ